MYALRNVVAVALALAVLGIAPALAAPKVEVGLGGQYVKFDNPEDHDGDSYNLDLAGSILFGLGSGGHVVAGPTFGISSDDDLNRLGGRVDWNFHGQKAVTFFIGGEVDYFIKDRDEGDQHSVLGLAGVKIALGPGAAIELAGVDVFDGVGKDTTDLGALLQVIGRW